MHLYSLTLQKTKAIVHAIRGNFSGGRGEEILVGKGKLLELLRPDEYGSLHSICEIEVFGVIRSLKPFRLPGSNVDHVVIGSDSGRLSVLKYDTATNQFERVHCETFGKTGVRRLVPGQYLAVDPHGRAVMVAALEKAKLVYVLARDESARMTINSPLEAYKSNTIVFDVCGLDVGFENPIFAALELGYADADQDPTGDAARDAEKMLTLYELDLGLNHVVRKWSKSIDRGANMLIPVPGGEDGPGGVIVCAEHWLIYRNQEHQDRELRTPLPTRVDNATGRGTLIVSYAMHKQKNLFFFLLQSEYGDIFRVTMRYSGTMVENVSVSYFDTVPVSSAMCVVETHAALFVAGEFGNHYFYVFKGDMEDGADKCVANSVVITDDMEDDQTTLYPPKFAPQQLKHLKQYDEIESLAPTTCFQVAELVGEETPQIYAACGRSSRSTLRILRHGLSVTQFATAPLPGVPVAVWTVGHQVVPGEDGEDDEVYHKYIVVSFLNGTLVLSIGDQIQQITTTDFLTDAQTLAVTSLADESMIQVHTGGFVHIRDQMDNVSWQTPGGKLVEHAVVNNKQLVLSLSGGELVYFELSLSGLFEEQERIDLGAEIKCVDVDRVPDGRQRWDYLAVGCFDQTVRVLSLDPNQCLAPLSTQALPAMPESLCMMLEPEKEKVFLNIGLANGVLVRSQLETSNGQLMDTRPQFLGTRPVKCFRVALKSSTGKPFTAMMALSSRPWLCYHHRERYLVTPLSYEAVEGASSFASEQVSDGIVAIAKDSLRFLSVDKIGESFNTQTFPLTYTPRAMIQHPSMRALVLIEGDHNTVSPQERAELKAKADELRQQTNPADAAPATNDMEMDGDDDDDDDDKPAPLTDAQTGYPKPEQAGRWASLIRVIDPLTGNSLQVVDLDADEMAVSCTTVVFHDRAGEVFLAVGTVKSLQWHPRKHKGGSIRLYELLGGGKLRFVHATPVNDIPYAMCQSPDEMLFSGVGNTLVVYSMGKKMLLQKYVYRSFPSLVMFVQTQGERVYVGDQRESVFILHYNRVDKSITEIADDTTPRMLTSAVVLDYDSVAGSDKFGNLFVLRLPEGVSDQAEASLSNSRALWNQNQNGAPHKLEQICQFHVGELVTCMRKTTLVPGKSDALVYTTVMGAVGAMVPFVSREDVDFFSHLELYVRQERVELVGRDHLQYRSYFIPVKDVIDGDLCEEYMSLPLDKQKQIAAELDRTPNEIIKKIEDLRNKVM